MLMSADMIPNINYHDFPMYKGLLVNPGERLPSQPKLHRKHSV